MLTFTFPWALGLLAAAGLVALFYFLRLRFRRQPVSSTFLWDKLTTSNDGGARLRWRSVILLVLQLAAVVLLVLALAGLQLVIQGPAQPGTVYVMDTSASMGVRQGATTRWQAAVDAVRADAKAHVAPLAVYADGRVTETDASGLAAVLAGLRPGDGGFDEAEAAAVIGAWSQTSRDSWSGALVTDGLEGGRLAHQLEGRWRALSFAEPAPNVGVTDLRLVPAVRATLFNAGAAASVEVTLKHQGREEKRTVTAPPGVSTVSWTTVPEEGVWEVSLPPDGLEADNSFTAVVEPSRRARVLHLGAPDPFVKAAFAGSAYTERGEPDTAGGPWDLVIVTDQWPAGWRGNTLTFGALPPDAPVFWSDPVTGRVAGTSQLLARWVPWDETVADQVPSLVVRSGADVVASVEGVPVAATWDKDARYAAVSLAAWNSNWGLTGALPLFARNLRQAVLPQEGNPLASHLRVGVPLTRAGSNEWNAPGVHAVRLGSLWEITALKRGRFPWTDGTEHGVLTASVPAAESDTAPRAPALPPAPEPRVFGNRADAVPLQAWLALAVLALLAAEWRLWNGRWRPHGRRGLTVLRGTAAAAALLTLAGLTLPWPTADRHVVLLFDASASEGPALVESQRQAAELYLSRLSPTDRAALVVFGGDVRVEAGWQSRDAARASLAGAPLTAQPGSTDVAAALSLGAALLEGKAGASQLVFTDGRANAGGALDALPSAARRYPVSAVPVGRPLGGVLGEGLELPAVRPGERAVARWQGWSDETREATLRLSIDGAVRESRRVTLTPGANTQEFQFEAGPAGTRRVDVAVSAEGRTLDAGLVSGLLEVSGGNRVLVVGADSAALADALSRQGLPVERRSPERLPDAAGYAGVSAVVLDNVPATALTAQQQRDLREWTAAGGGLLVVGGDRSLGRGEYYTSALEEVLPVQTDSRQRLQFTRSRLLFVVDHSGSMSEDVGKTTKLAAALGGIAQSLDALTSQDEVGLLEFDSESTWVQPFTPVAKKQALLDALGRFSQGGGTDLTKALDEVVEAFGHPGPVKRHVILMTDGQTGGEDNFFNTFTETMKAAQVSLTVVGIGNEVNETLLRALASGSDGVYYRAQGGDIPAIVHQETVRVTKDLVQEGLFQPVGRGDALPEVRGYLSTKPKPLATVEWAVGPADARDPLYATGRYGAGRVGVFTADSGKRWLTAWSGRPEYNRFWSQAVRALEAGGRGGLRVDASVSASVAHVVVEAVDGGRLLTGASLTATQGGRTYPLAEVAPGRYETELPVDQGLQLVTVNDQAGSRATTWLWNPSGTETARGGIDWAALGRLTASGGRLEPLASPSPPPATWGWTPVGVRDALLLLALVLLVVELGWRSLSMGQGRAALAQFGAWWQAQRKPWTRAAAAPMARDEAEVERRTREAYKYLAGRRRKDGTS